MPKSPAAQPYRSFLLRCWREQPSETEELPAWRFSLREVAEIPQEQRFSSPEQLIDFLLAKLVLLWHFRMPVNIGFSLLVS